jgi:hypothetical protein
MPRMKKPLDVGKIMEFKPKLLRKTWFEAFRPEVISK